MPMVRTLHHSAGGASMSMTHRIILIVLITLVALVVGLLLRLLLVRRLKQTVLDDWLIQTLGVIVVLAPLIVAVAATPFILDSTNTLLLGLLDSLKKKAQAPDLASLIWAIIQTLLILVLGVGIARTLLKLTIRSQSHLDINLRTLIG